MQNFKKQVIKSEPGSWHWQEASEEKTEQVWYDHIVSSQSEDMQLHFEPAVGAQATTDRYHGTRSYNNPNEKLLTGE